MKRYSHRCARRWSAATKQAWNRSSSKRNGRAMLWEVDIYPLAGQPNLLARRVAADAADLGLGRELCVDAARGYLIQGQLSREQIDQIAQSLLVDAVVERAVIGKPGEAGLSQPPAGFDRLIHVLPKPGVMDPVAQSALAAVSDL